jgi:hypothetical protein
MFTGRMRAAGTRGYRGTAVLWQFARGCLHLAPLHLAPLHLAPLHLAPLHLAPLHLAPLHVSTVEPSCSVFVRDLAVIFDDVTVISACALVPRCQRRQVRDRNVYTLCNKTNVGRVRALVPSARQPNTRPKQSSLPRPLLCPSLSLSLLFHRFIFYYSLFTIHTHRHDQQQCQHGEF